MLPGRDWKSRAADRLDRMGESDSAKALYGVGDKKRPPAEMTASQMREVGKRRAAKPKPRPRSRLARLLAWFKLQS